MGPVRLVLELEKLNVLAVLLSPLSAGSRTLIPIELEDASAHLELSTQQSTAAIPPPAQPTVDHAKKPDLTNVTLAPALTTKNQR